MHRATQTALVGFPLYRPACYRHKGGSVCQKKYEQGFTAKKPKVRLRRGCQARRQGEAALQRPAPRWPPGRGLRREKPLAVAAEALGGGRTVGQGSGGRQPITASSPDVTRQH